MECPDLIENSPNTHVSLSSALAGFVGAIDGAEIPTGQPLLLGTWGNCVLTLLILSAQLYEVHHVHGDGSLFWRRANLGGGIETELQEALPRVIRLRYSMFAMRRFPISTLILCVGPLFIFSSLAWLGLLDRRVWVERLLRLMILWIACMPFSLGISNVVGIVKYLPASMNDLKTSARNSSWWGWLGLKLVFGSPDYHNVLHSIWWYVTLSWAVWPYRYFFFYRYAVFTGDKQKSADIFILNMIIHTSLLLGTLFYVHIVAFGSSKWIARNLYLNRWPIATFCVAVMSAICVLRVLWFLCTCFFSMSWWGSWTVLAFINLHILALFGYLPVTTALLQRDNSVLFLQGPFSIKYQELYVKEVKSKEKEDVPSSDAPNLTAEANQVFQELLDVTCERFVFQPSPEESRKNQTTPDDAILFLANILEIVLSHRDK